jgi:hypothetical protein
MLSTRSRGRSLQPKGESPAVDPLQILGLANFDETDDCDSDGAEDCYLEEAEEGFTD